MATASAKKAFPLVLTVALAAGHVACSDGAGSGDDPGSGGAGAGGAATGGGGEGAGGADPLPDGAVATTVEVEYLAAQDDGTMATFGQPFVPGEIATGKTLLARLDDGTPVRLQVDPKATHADGSLRHAVLTVELPAGAPGDRQAVELVVSSEPIVGEPPSRDDLVASGFDATVNVTSAGQGYVMSASDHLANGTPWLSGPLVSEWLVDAPVASGGTAHPHLAGRMAIRAYQGLEAVRVSVTLENTWTFVPGPQNVSYDVSVSLAGEGEVFSQPDVTHYRQSRWRRAFWRGTAPAIHVVHDADHLWRTGAVPRYAPTLNASESSLVELGDVWNTPDGDIMGPGPVDTYMPGGGARGDIGPLPRWTALYLISQDHRAFDTMVRASEQAASWPVHFRDESTGEPLSVAEHPEVAILGSDDGLPACGGDCSTPYEPDDAHQPSLAYVPYLLTGDVFHLEELQFWAAYDSVYWGDHGGPLGLVLDQQIRGQAWSLRTIAHAAYVTPDDHPFKASLWTVVDNNVDAYLERYVVDAPNALGHVVPRSGTSIAFWQDDFFTWMVGALVDMGFSQAAPLLDFKARFSVGRMTDPEFCWVMASANWVVVHDDGDAALFDTFGELYQHLVVDDPEGIAPDWIADSIRADTDAFLAAECASEAMGQLMGFPAGTMIGYPDNPESYSMNIGPALAAAVDAGLPDAELAWTTWQSRANDYAPSLDETPHWAVVPRALETP